jgi:hypothetical protein
MNKKFIRFHYNTYLQILYNRGVEKIMKIKWGLE